MFSLPSCVNDDTNSINNACSICLSNLNNSKTKTFTCNHTFHETCINEWLKDKDTCPMCRVVINVKPVITTNININVPRDLPPRTNFMKKIKKPVIVSVFILSILFHFCSSIYNIFLFYKTNIHINNYIKTLNDTELGAHNHNTYNPDVLIAYDIFYYLFLIIININIFNGCKNNCCGYAGGFILMSIMIITNCIIRSSFASNTNEYLNDDKLNFDSSYNTNLMTSYTIFLSSYGANVIISFYSYIQLLS
jgi:hypothetical protein